MKRRPRPRLPLCDLLAAAAVTLLLAGSASAGSLVAQWSFDETTGQAILDGGGSHDGTLGTDPVNVDSADPTRLTDGHRGGALDFQGAKEAVVASHADFALQTLTLEVYYRMEVGGTTGGNRHLVSKSLSTGSSSFAMFTRSGGKVSFYLAPNAAGAFTESPQALLQNDGAWHQLVGTYDGSKLRLYQDGVEQGAGTNATLTVAYNTGDLFFGTFQSGSSLGWQHDLDEVRIFDAAMTPAEIAAFDAAHAAPEPAALAVAGLALAAATRARRRRPARRDRVVAGSGWAPTETPARS